MQKQVISESPVYEGWKLDLGCGPSLHEEDEWIYYDVRIADYAKPSMHGLKSRRFVIGDARQGLPFKDNIFSHVRLSQVIEHFTLNQSFLVLPECYRVAREGATLEISTPNYRTLGYALWVLDDYNVSLQPHFSLDCAAFPYGTCTGPWLLDTVTGGAAGYDDDSQFQHHRCCYNADILNNLLVRVGFKEIKITGDKISWWLHAVAIK